MTSEAEIEKKRKKRLRKSRLLTILILALGLAISVLVAQYAVINNYVSKNLSQFIENRINENMDADSYFHFDSLHVNVWRNRISTRNISLHLKAEDEIIAKAPALVINVGSLLKFWWKEELFIDQLILQDPYVEVIQINESDTSSVDNPSSNSLDQIIQHIDLLQLKDIHLKSANIRFYKKNEGSDKKQLDFQLNNLSIDLQRLKIEADNFLGLETEKLTINLRDQQFILPDSSMQMDIKSIDYDHLHKGFDFTDISIISLPDNDILLDVPRLEAHQVLVDEEKLSIDSFSILGPKVLLTQQILDLIQANDGKKSPLKIPFIQSIEIKTIDLNQGKLNGVLADSLGLSVKNWGLTIKDLGWSELDKNPYHIGLTRMYLEDLSLNQPNNPSPIRLQKLRIEYPENNFFMDSVSFNMNSLKGTLALIALYDLNMQSLANNEFVLEELVITDPSIVANVQNLKLNAKDSNKPMFEKWQVGKIRVANLDVFMDQTPHSLTVKNGDIYATKFDFNRNEEFTSENLEDFTFYLPTLNYNEKQKNVKLTINNTYYTSFDSLLSISDGNFKNNTTSINWKKLNAKNGTTLTQPVDSILLNYFSIGSYEIIHSIKEKAAKERPAFPIMMVDSLRLGKGYAKVTKGKDFLMESLPQELLVEGLVYDSSQWQLDELSFVISDISAKNSELDASIDELAIQSSKNSIRLADIKFEKRDSIQGEIRSRIADIEIKLYDLPALLNQPDNIKIREISITNPEVRVTTTESKEEVELKVVNTWSENASSIFIDQLEIENATFAKKSNDSQLDISGLNLKFSTIELTDDSLIFEKNLRGLLYAQSFNGFLSEVNFHNALDSISIKDIELGEVIATENFSHTSSDTDRVVAFDGLRLEGFQPNEWLINRKVKAKSFLVDHPHVKVKQKSEDSVTQRSTPVQIILDSLNIVNADLDLEWGANQALKLFPLNISIGEFEYDSEIEEFQWPAKTYEISTKNLAFQTRNGLELIRLDQVSLNNSQLKVTDFSLEPLFDREAYFNQIGYETDHIRLTIPSIRLETFDQALLLKDSILNAAKLIIEKPTLIAFRDQNYPDPDPLYKTMPVSAIQSIPFPMRIDSIEVSGAHVTYEMIPDGGVESGTFTFGDLNAHFSSVTNTPKQDEIMNISVTANAMDIIPMVVSFDFDLNSVNDEFSFKGSVAPHSMKTFNSYTENGAFVKVISGNTKNLSFAVQASDTVGYGTMDFAYNNLKIAILDKETYSQSNVDESFVSFIANTFLVRKRNRFISKYRQGDIYFQRIQHKAIFNFLAKLFISGTASSVGLRNHEKEVEIVKEALEEAK